MLPIYKKSHRRRALVAVLVCILTTVLIGFLSLTIDVGYMYATHMEMQATVDSSALAGVTAAAEDASVAVSRALSAGTNNAVAGRFVRSSELQVQIGYWNAATPGFTLPVGGELAAPNATRVVGGRNEIPLFFAGIFGVANTDVLRGATALYGGGRCAGMWGLDGIDGNGSLTTDSYDSSAGAYGAGNVYLNGDICSDNDIDLDGNVSIGGDAMFGDGFALTTAGNAYDIYGVVTEQRESVAVPPFDMADAAVNNDNATIGLTTVHNRDPFNATFWDFEVTGNDSMTIPPGTYYMTSAALTGQATLIITGPTVFFISGPAAFTGGGLVNVSQNPSDLIIYSTGPTLEIDGSAGFYGSIIAPTTTVTFTGNSQIYGTVMAGFLQLAGDTQIHIDSNAVLDLFGVGPEAPVLVQ